MPEQELEVALELAQVVVEQAMQVAGLELVLVAAVAAFVAEVEVAVVVHMAVVEGVVELVEEVEQAVVGHMAVVEVVELAEVE